MAQRAAWEPMAQRAAWEPMAQRVGRFATERSATELWASIPAEPPPAGPLGEMHSVRESSC